jgi:hypothetical protein
MDPHQGEKLNPDSDTHKRDKLDPDHHQFEDDKPKCLKNDPIGALFQGSEPFY